LHHQLEYKTQHHSSTYHQTDRTGASLLAVVGLMLSFEGTGRNEEHWQQQGQVQRPHLTTTT